MVLKHLVYTLVTITSPQIGCHVTDLMHVKLQFDKLSKTHKLQHLFYNNQDNIYLPLSITFSLHPQYWVHLPWWVPSSFQAAVWCFLAFVDVPWLCHQYLTQGTEPVVSVALVFLLHHHHHHHLVL